MISDWSTRLLYRPGEDSMNREARMRISDTPRRTKLGRTSSLVEMSNPALHPWLT